MVSVVQHRNEIINNISYVYKRVHSFIHSTNIQGKHPYSRQCIKHSAK